MGFWLKDLSTAGFRSILFLVREGNPAQSPQVPGGTEPNVRDSILSVSAGPWRNLIPFFQRLKEAFSIRTDFGGSLIVEITGKMEPSSKKSSRRVCGFFIKPAEAFFHHFGAVFVYVFTLGACILKKKPRVLVPGNRSWSELLRSMRVDCSSGLLPG